MAVAVAATIGAERGEDHPLLTMLSVTVEWSALLALAMIWAWQPEVRTGRTFLRLVVALWGATAFGIFHQMLAYMIMVGFSERDWDEPPGTGYLTVAAIAGTRRRSGRRRESGTPARGPSVRGRRTRPGQTPAS